MFKIQNMKKKKIEKKSPLMQKSKTSDNTCHIVWYYIKTN